MEIHKNSCKNEMSKIFFFILSLKKKNIIHQWEKKVNKFYEILIKNF